MSEKLLAYLGFVRRMKKLYAGMALEKKLEEGKVSLLLLFPSVTDKSREKLTRRDDKVMCRDVGEIDFARLGLKSCKALGIGDEGLAKAIIHVLDEKEVEDERQEKQTR